MDNTRRRRVLRLGGAALLSGLAGCIAPGGGGDDENDIQDTDGDGVIDTEDYAPRDPEVQREEQVKGGESTETPSETETPPETETPIAEEDLLNRWPFTQDFSDTVGGIDASVPIGDPQIETVAGQTAVEFDGDDGMRVARGGDQPELSLLDQNDGPASITMQVYFADATGGQPSGGTGTASHSILKDDTGYRITARGESESSSVNLNFSVSSFGDTPAQGYSMPDDVRIPLPVQEWHQLSFVFNSTEYVRIYVDDEQVFADESMEGYNNPASDFWPDITIGSWYGGNPEEWANLMNGAISDLRIYNTGLTAGEVSQIYTNTN